MPSIPLAIACVPLALYLIRLGTLNLRRRPVVVSGALDAAALAFGITGLVVVGPLNLFLPDAATQRFGPFVWLLVLGFYTLSVTLYLLVARPRLVVFNVQPDKLRLILDEIVHRLDSQAQVAGDAIHAPQLAVQLHLDLTPNMRNVTLVATGDQQSQSGWNRLRRELASALREVEMLPNPRGFTFLTIGILLAGWPIVQLLQTPSHLVAQQLRDILRM
jgi:hypothetical protein